ncbi:MAG TPA: chemotaxis protein CheA [Bryobacteraceae bacterium]|nr:chemotaxis protein CheA [Bryobacteraceae bacterium]
MTGGFEQTFREEARDLLGDLEAALLELDERPEDAELVARAFRALHTIKGSGAMFGFDEIARFSHELEAAFDRLRKGEAAVESSLIRLALAAGDEIRRMLDAPEGGCSPEAGRILADLRKWSGEAESAPPRESGEGEAGEDGAAGEPEDWFLRFSPGPEVMIHGSNPLLLLGELRGLGETVARAEARALPPLAELDPERCYAGWEIALRTGAGMQAIRDVFLFVEDESELTIRRREGRRDPSAPLALRARNAEAAARAAQAPAAASSVRVAAEKLDQLVNLVGELVTVQARLSEVSSRLDDSEIGAISEEIDRLTAELRANSMSIRMLPLRNTFERFRRLVHDLGAELGKQADLTIEGADTELDKTVIERLNDPLVHLIRNSMDHGIETPEARLAVGKPARAAIRLSASHSGAQVLIRVSDDGRGLDAKAVRARAVEQGLVAAGAELSEAEVLQLILAPGFSTARQVTDISGRGVGMDVVRRSVEDLRGSVEVRSAPGAGLTVTLRLPLTLAIIDGLLVRVAQAHFILPLANSLECVELTRGQIEEAHGNRLASVRGQTIPYIRLSEYFEMDAPRPERERIMVVETEEGRYGLAVDDVLGYHQTVIKNIGRLYRDAPMVSGATILGNGTVALILDPQRLVQDAIHLAGSGRRAALSLRGIGAEGAPSKGKQNRCYAA